jgi:hypothetical protein
MSFKVEVLYRSPPDSGREERIAAVITPEGGRLTFREEPMSGDSSQAICLTYEFPDLASAEAAASALRKHGEHVEGPVDYGDD